MSRIQHILDKAEREGAAFRTSGISVPAAAPAPAAAPIAPVPATVPITIDIPTPQVPDPLAIRDIGAGAPAAPPPARQTTGATAGAPAIANDGIQSYTVRLNPLLVAGLAPTSLAAE